MHKNKGLKSTSSLSETTLSMTIRQAFEIKMNPFPWAKAISAGICSGLPVLIGLILGNIQYGLLAGIGSFTYLYVFNEPYAQRAKKLFFVLLAMSISVGLGTLLAPTPIASAIMVGLIGAIATFVFGALKIPGPAAIFFVLGFTMTTGMPLDPALAPLRTGLVLLGGILSWIIGMIPWFFKPHGPETIAVKKVYKELASFIDSVGTDHFNDARQKAVFTLQSAEDTLIAGYTSWRSSDLYKRLLLLNGHANTIFLYILEHISEKNVKLPTELGASVRALADSIDHNNMCTKIRQPELSR